MTDFTLAADLLHHPMGRRATDVQLARAVLHGHTGRILDRARPTLPSLRSGLRRAQRTRLATGPMPIARRWRLPRAWQRDQGETPHCVAFTEKHWELSLPIANRSGLAEAEMYARAKTRDGFPTEEGTSAWAMLQVCLELGLIADAWEWTGPQDTAAAITWLLTVGPLWWGASWSESMFRTNDDFVVEVTDEPLWGHETLWIGYTPNYRCNGHGYGACVEGVNSWGNSSYGYDGRFWLPLAVWQEKLAQESDLWGVIEQRVL